MSPRFYLFTTVRPVNAVSVAVTVVTTLLRLINRVETCSALNRCRYSKTLLDLVFEVCAFVRSKLPANREIESVFTSCLRIQCHRTLFAPSCQPTGEIESVFRSCVRIQCYRILFRMLICINLKLSVICECGFLCSKLPARQFASLR